VDALKHALAMGVNAAALVDASGVTGGDLWTTAEALAAAVKAQGGVDLVLTGKQSVDDNSGAVFAGVAAKLGWPLVTGVTKIVDDRRRADHRRAHGRRRPGDVERAAARRRQRGQGDQRPALPQLHGHPQGQQGQHPGHACRAWALPGSGKTQWTNIRKPEERKTKVTMIDGATRAGKGRQAGRRA
jgi:electron transfer flavoprotein beta subunit